MNYLSRIQPGDPAYVQSLVSAADVYQTLGLYEVSEQKLLEAKRLAPDEPVVTFALGEFYFDWGHFAEAISAYNELLAAGTTELAGVNIEARLAASLAQTGQYEDAVAAYEDVGVDALDLNGRFELGGLYLQLDDPAKAITNLQAVIDSDPSYANAYLPLARAYEAQNQPDKALDTVQAGVMVDDTNPTLYALGGKLALSEDNVKLAETYLQRPWRLIRKIKVICSLGATFWCRKSVIKKMLTFLTKSIVVVMLTHKFIGIWLKATIGWRILKKPVRITF